MDSFLSASAANLPKHQIPAANPHINFPKQLSTGKIVIPNGVFFAP
jgi:hypothetical protein